MKKFLAITSLLALGLAACAPTADDGTGPIKIGFIGPLTGDVASLGTDDHNGVLLKVREINAAGGINGRQIELISEDARCTGADSASAAQKLVSVDQVIAIIGGLCSGETLAAAPITEAGKVVLLSPTSSSPDVTSAGDFVFRNYPSDALKTKAMAKYFKDNGMTKVAIIAENTDFSVGFRDSLAKDIGMEFVFNEVVEPGTKDFRSLMTRLKDVDFDVFVADGQSPPTIALMVQQLREQGMEQVAITHDAGQTEETIALGGASVEGFRAINVASLSSDSAFGKTFIAENGAPQAGLAYAGYAYDAMGVLAQSIAEVGTDAAMIRDYLYQIPSYSGVVGNFSFDENGDVLGINYKLIEVQNGAWVELADAPAM